MIVEVDVDQLYESFMGVAGGDDDIMSTVGEAWQGLIGDREVKRIAYFNTGLAEACHAIIQFKDSSYMVATGESLRPTIIHYQGTDGGKAWDAFNCSFDELIPDEIVSSWEKLA